MYATLLAFILASTTEIYVSIVDIDRRSNSCGKEAGKVDISADLLQNISLTHQCSSDFIGTTNMVVTAQDWQFRRNREEDSNRREINN